ncbi:MAG: cytochrome C oxidase subunit IV family protein [Chloroflexi bacterium]|nr:cytochrome C oxidase subunit IV family protein [Chloroflexota bacterium]
MEHDAAARERAHPGPLEYIKIGLTLAIVTAVEVVVYYIDALEDVLVPILIVLSALKFSLVALWFMHLRFDSRLFSTFFVGGLMLAAAIFVVAVATLGGSLR